MDVKKIKRNPNFTRTEVQVMVDEIEKYKAIMYSKQNTTPNNIRKKQIWSLICSKVNHVNTTGFVREPHDIRRKWACLMSDTKKKKMNEKNMPVCYIDPLEEHILRLGGYSEKQVEDESGGRLIEETSNDADLKDIINMSEVHIKVEVDDDEELSTNSPQEETPRVLPGSVVSISKESDKSSNKFSPQTNGNLFLLQGHPTIEHTPTSKESKVTLCNLPLINNSKPCPAQSNLNNAAANLRPLLPKPSHIILHTEAISRPESTSPPLATNNKNQSKKRKSDILDHEELFLLTAKEQQLYNNAKHLDIKEKRLQVEAERLNVEKERLNVEKERLKLESERLCMEKERMIMEQERLKFEKEKYMKSNLMR